MELHHCTESVGLFWVSLRGLFRPGRRRDRRRGRSSPTRCRTRRRPSTGCRDRKSTRLNSSHLGISDAVFCLKKKRHNMGEDLDEEKKTEGGKELIHDKRS